MNLKVTVEYIKETYRQEFIELNDYDFSLNKNLVLLKPKYLFRGERNHKWRETKSTAQRSGIIDQPNFNEINYWVLGIHPITHSVINNYSLCFFLGSILFDGNTSDTEAQKSIIGLLQHYQFDTSFIDLTSDINVAAFFASHDGSIGDIGQIFVIPTKSIENRFFDLSTEKGNRPTRQSSFVIPALGDFDLKSSTFIEQTGACWINFELDKDDKVKFDNSSLLSLSGDRVAPHIIDWYDSHITNNTDLLDETRHYFGSKIETLKKFL